MKFYHEVVDCWIFHSELVILGWVPPIENKSIPAITQNDQNSINFISVYTNFAMNLWVNISHKLNNYDESMLSHKMTFYLFNFFAETENDNLNLDKFIKDCEVISHESIHDVYKEFSNVGDSLCLYDTNKYIIK